MQVYEQTGTLYALYTRVTQLGSRIHYGLTKMTRIFLFIFLCILTHISLQFVPKGPTEKRINKKKSLPEQSMNKSHNAYSVTSPQVFILLKCNLNRCLYFQPQIAQHILCILYLFQPQMHIFCMKANILFVPLNDRNTGCFNNEKLLIKNTHIKIYHTLKWQDCGLLLTSFSVWMWCHA